MSGKITYEQPLNERVRNLLRLEHLFSLINDNMHDKNEWHCRFVLEAMLEILDLLSRSDFKAEVIKELEKHLSMLNALKDNPGVDPQRLNSITNRIAELLSTLKSSDYQPGAALKNDELVTSFKQRVSIPGGTCGFDLPRFNHWLNLSESIRQQDLERWFLDLEPVKQASMLTLDMIRNSTNPTMEIAEAGFYQKPLESNISCQLIRVLLPAGCAYFPEISGGKHRFTIRFMESKTTKTRPNQAETDVEFELRCCML